MANAFRALPPTVLADLLSLPGRERFCLRVLSWLLEEEGEHGLKRDMLEHFAAFLDLHEQSELAAALQSGVLPLGTDLVERDDTVDLVVTFAGSARLALLVASRLLVNSPVLTDYKELEMTPIGLRLPGDPPSKQLGSFPVWDWLAPVPALAERAPPGPYGDFLRQFANRLRGVDAGPVAPVLGAAGGAPGPAPEPAPEPSGYGGGWGGDSGGGLADSWSEGDGGGGLADAWMNDLG